MRSLLTSWACVAGAGLIVYGCSLVSGALGWVVGGAAVIVIAVSER